MEALSNRKQDLLAGIVQEYTETARPVGSKWLVDKLGLDLSSATIRNEMKELEDQGFITHPHTSAGRIPTTLGYRYYIEHFLDKATPLAASYQQRLDDVLAMASDPTVKQLAKTVAEISNEAVLVSLNHSSFYYTGITNLFRKPEFQDIAEVTVLSELIDHFDDVMIALQQHQFDDVEVLLAEENPVSQYCATVVTRYAVTSQTSGVMAILGPTRMNYQLNHQILRHVHEIFNKVNQVSVLWPIHHQNSQMMMQ